MAIDEQCQEHDMNEVLLVSSPLRIPCCEPGTLHSVTSGLHQRGAKNDLGKRQDPQRFCFCEGKLTCQEIGGQIRQEKSWARTASMPRRFPLSHFLWPRRNRLDHRLPPTARPPPVHGVRLQHMA